MEQKRPPEYETRIIKEYEEGFLAVEQENREVTTEDFMEYYSKRKKIFHEGGQNALIFEFEHDKFGTVVVKEKRSGAHSGFAQNSIVTEFNYQDELHDKYKIPCPKPILVLEHIHRDYINKKITTTEVVVMEKIHGYSVGDYYRDANAILELPKNFSLRSFMDKLSGYIQEMHKNGIYHNDLTMNNVMINELGDPVIIDFGTTRTSFGEDPYEAPESIVTINGVRTIQKLARFVPDEENLETINDGLKQVLKIRKLVDLTNI